MTTDCLVVLFGAVLVTAIVSLVRRYSVTLNRTAVSMVVVIGIATLTLSVLLLAEGVGLYTGRTNSITKNRQWIVKY